MEKRRYTKNLIEHYPSKDDSRTTIIKGAKISRGNGGKMFPLFHFLQRARRRRSSLSRNQ